MLDLHGQLCWIASILLVLPAALPCLLATATTPTFLQTSKLTSSPPRNETYAPSGRFPVAFAIQNPEFARSLGLFILWDLERYGDPNSHRMYSKFQLRRDNFSSSDPYFFYHHFNTTTTDETGPIVWEFSWELFWGNCSDDPGFSLGNATGIRGDSERQTFVFTIKNGGQPLDLVVAAGDGGVCANLQNKIFNVTAVRGVDATRHDRDTCAQLASPGNPTPTSNPCGARVGSAVASSISAAIASDICSQRMDQPGCSTQRNGAAGRGGGRRSMVAAQGAGWMLPLGCSLMYFFLS